MFSIWAWIRQSFGIIFLYGLSVAMLLGILGLISIVAIIIHYNQGLPSLEELENYEPSIVTRVHASDGRLLAEFADERRVYIPSEEIPDLVKQAFIATEDARFYAHQGVDPIAILRAIITNIKEFGEGRPQGASTITQQVAKNFLLSNELSLERKIKEAILAFKIERTFDKETILELYLNEIYLGNRSYGIGSAALNYFDKSLDDLTIAQSAFLAGLPQAPSTYNPLRNYDAAIRRRAIVLRLMREDGYITRSQEELALLTVIDIKERELADFVKAPYFAEEVRRRMIDIYGQESLYQGGLSIRTSVDPVLQEAAKVALRRGLMKYDRRQGWRGPIERTGSIENWQERLNAFIRPYNGLREWDMGIVLSENPYKVGITGGQSVRLSDASAVWANARPDKGTLKKGDVIFVQKNDEEGEDAGTYMLQQIPDASGGLIALDPLTGRVLAMQGGWFYGHDQFNRVVQAKRQPGSAFKPFVYLTALEKGYTPSTLVLDAPIEYVDRAGNVYRPKNYTNDFYGPTTLRKGVEKSRNLMTVRLADHVGLDAIADIAKRFDIYPDMNPFLSSALGAEETTLIQLASAYGVLVNGGRQVTPTLIDRIQDREGATIYESVSMECRGCGPLIRWEGQNVPDIRSDKDRIISPEHAFQMVSILEGVVQRGTATRLKSLNRPLAGKTGTTNESRDVWFMGMTPDLVVGVYIGYDTPKPLGPKETGSSVAAPVFKMFLDDIITDIPIVPFRTPPGIQLSRINPETGRRARSGQNTIWEAYVEGTGPENQKIILDKGQVMSANAFHFDPNAYIMPYTPQEGEIGYNPYAYMGQEDLFNAPVIEPLQAISTTEIDGVVTYIGPDGEELEPNPNENAPIYNGPEKSVIKTESFKPDVYTGTGGIY